MGKRGLELVLMIIFSHISRYFNLATLLGPISVLSIRYLALGLETSISILAFLREFAGEFLWYLLVLLIFDSEFMIKMLIVLYLTIMFTNRKVEH